MGERRRPGRVTYGEGMSSDSMKPDRGYAGFKSVPINDAAELAAIQSLRERLALVPSAIKRWDRIAKIQPARGSEVALDDEATAWRNLSHALSHQLNHAADTLNALTVLIPPEGPLALPYVAHYAVARSALEAASLAMWVVHPDDPRLRVERHLRNAWREVSAEAAMTSAMLKAIANDPAMGLMNMLDKGRKQDRAFKRKHVGQIRTSALRIGLDDPTQSAHTVGFAEIVRESTNAVGLRGVYGEIVWRELSGLSHPSLMRSVRSMDLEEVIDHGDGTVGAMFTSNMSRAKYSVEAAYLAFTGAVEIFAARKIRPGDLSRYAPSP